jgi:hypothetical protein
MLRIIFTLGLITAACLLGYSISYYKAMDFYAVLLAILAGSYLGFGFADGRRDKLILEASMALGILVLILLAMWKMLWLIAVGYVVQVLWGVLHYPLAIGARVPKKYALMFLLFNSAIAAFLFIRFV